MAKPTPPGPPHREPFPVEQIVTGSPGRRPYKVVAVLPAYNAEKTLTATLADVPAGAVDEVILVDDGSKDGTVSLARRMGLTVIEHPQNRGYGGNQKTCYRHALDR